MTSPVATVVRPPLPVDLRLTLGPLSYAPHDPCTRFDAGGVWHATNTPDGPATLRLEGGGHQVRVTVWGPGAARAMERAPGYAGARDRLDGWEPGHLPLVAAADERLRGFRLPASGGVLEAAVAAVLAQKIQGIEAAQHWRRLVRRYGTPAPGPAPDGMMAPPDAATLTGLAYWAFHPLGVERRRAQIVLGLAARAPRVEEAAALGGEAGRRRLMAFPGVGAWTAAEVAQRAWADADAVSVGDFHLARHVIHALTGRRDGTDDELIEILEPFRPHRGRAALLLMMAAPKMRRRAPRVRLYDRRAM